MGIAIIPRIANFGKCKPMLRLPQAEKMTWSSVDNDTKYICGVNSRSSCKKKVYINKLLKKNSENNNNAVVI